MVQTAQFTETSAGEADSCDLLPPGVGDVYGQKGCCPLFGPPMSVAPAMRRTVVITDSRGMSVHRIVEFPAVP